MGKPIKQLHLAAAFPGVHSTTVWSDPAAGSPVEFDSFRRLAQTAERGRFDFLFLAEEPWVRDRHGLIHDLDVIGRPDTLTVLTALAAVTEKLGLTGTVDPTFNEPYEVARRFASLDHLSAGRAAWHVVTSWGALTGENFRRGGYLAQEDRYERAETFLRVAQKLFDSWRGDEITADQDAGVFLTDKRLGGFDHHDAHFDIAGRFNVPRSPQGRPVILHAGDSGRDRDFAASSADVILSPHRAFDAGQAFYADVKGRLAGFGRTREELLILPGATFVVGDTDREAEELAHEVRLAQVSPATAINVLEQVWNRDLSDHDPDGPLPAVDPAPGEEAAARGHTPIPRDALATANEWRARAEAEKLTSRELVIEVIGRRPFVGSPATVAETIDHFVQEDAADGFVLIPHITPGGLDMFVDRVVPLLQERGVFRAEYEGGTLREHLGLAPLPAPRAGGAWVLS